MKYATFFITLIFFTAVSAKTIESFRQSDAIATIINILSEDAEDLKTSYHVSDKDFKIKDVSKCEASTAEQALRHFKTAMDSILKIFPDEEIPYEEALHDMKDYLDGQPLLLCKFFHSDEKHKIATYYYFDKSDKIHLRVDTLNLIQ